MSWDRLTRVIDESHSAPALAVSLSDARDQLRLDDTLDDASLDRLIRAATDFVEGPHGYGLALREQTWDLFLDYFPAQIVVPIGPLRSVESITYVTPQQETLTVDLATTEFDRERGLIRPLRNESWPSTDTIYKAVTVRFSAGFDPLPHDIQHAILLLVTHWRTNPEPVLIGSIAQTLPFGVESILNRYRRGWFA